MPTSSSSHDRTCTTMGARSVNVRHSRASHHRVLLCLSAIVSLVGQESLDGAGIWRLALDRDDQGIQERWFAGTLPTAGPFTSVQFPGSLAVRGIGDPVALTTPWTAGIDPTGWYDLPCYAPYRTNGNIKMSCWLTPDTTWRAPAWFQRDIEIPAHWQGKRLQLTLERPHISTHVWLDGQPLGSCDSLSVPHQYEMGMAIAPGRHQVTIRVDNRLSVINVGHNSHSLSDQTQGNWNGIVGAITIAATTPVAIAQVHTFPNRAAKRLTVQGTLRNAGAPAGRGTIVVKVTGPGVAASSDPVPVSWGNDGGSFAASVNCGPDVREWDEFHPNLYRVETMLSGNPAAEDVHQTTCGFRDIQSADGRLSLNDHPLFLRGTLECCIFPKTGHPPMEADEWRRILTVAKAHGLNHLRFHSWCPPEVAFRVADDMGMYYQIESASWAFDNVTLGDGLPLDTWLHVETKRILDAYGNHPSFVLMTYGVEPHGDHFKPYLADWITRCRTSDPRRLYSGASGWPLLPEDQFHVAIDPRIQGWGQGLGSRINARPPETRTDYRSFVTAQKAPVISHETGQWCAFPNLAERSKYTGHLKAKNFDIFADFLTAAGMMDQAHEFLIASGKLQTLCYKEDIESALRTPGMGGFQLLDLHDFPGQGSALVGVLDAFWDSKGYVTPQAYARFCGPTVPLAKMDRRVFTTQDTLTADVEVAHFGSAPLAHAAFQWHLKSDDGKDVAQGTFPAQAIPIGNGMSLGHISLPLATVPAPHRYRLEVELPQTTIANDWDIWVYPETVSTDVPATVMLTDRLDEHATEVLAKGGRVLWTVPPRLVRKPQEGPIALGFSSIFWNTAFTDGQPPHTLGILCNPDHPLFTEFPTDGWSNWQWWYAIHDAAPLLCDGLPATLRPVVQIVPNWFSPHRIGLVVEATVGAGKLLITSVPIAEPKDPVTRQFRHALLTYAASERWAPAVALTIDQARSFLAEPTMARLGATITADGFAPGFPPGQAIDGDSATRWQSPLEATSSTYPHQLTITFPRMTTISGLALTPGRDKAHGRVKDYVISVSADGITWKQVAAGSIPTDQQRLCVRFPTHELLSHIKIDLPTGQGTAAGFAEIEALVPADVE